MAMIGAAAASDQLQIGPPMLKMIWVSMPPSVMNCGGRQAGVVVIAPS